MKTVEARVAIDEAELRRVSASVRQDLAGTACPQEYVRLACEAAERAAARAVSEAETRERRRIVRWLRTVAEVYANRSRSGKGDETVYWFDQLEAFSHAAAAIARRRHVQPH